MGGWFGHNFMLMPSGLVVVLVPCNKGQKWATDLWLESGKADWYCPSSKMVELKWHKQENSSGFGWWRERLNATLLLEGMVAFWTRSAVCSWNVMDNSVHLKQKIARAVVLAVISVVLVKQGKAG